VDAGEPVTDAEFSFSDGIDENGYFIGIKALDYVELFDYGALVIPKDTHTISDDDVRSTIDKYLSEYSSTKEITDRNVADNDTVNIDYVGSVDGVEFNGGSTEGTGTKVTIGETSYIDDFLEQLIGHMPGETFDIEVTFPDDYHVETLQGKDAVFVTTINYIAEEEAAVLTDDFVQVNFSETYGWTTIDEMKEGIRLNLQSSAIQQYIQKYFATEVPVKSVPDQLIKYQQKAMLKSYRDYATTYLGIELEEYLSTYEGFSSVEEFIEAYHDNAVESASFYLVSQALAEDAGFVVNDDDMSSFLGTTDYSSYEAQYGLPYLKQAALCQKVLDYVTERTVLA
jgi:trigger factor